MEWLAVPAAALLLLWPAIWNRYPIIFADTGTYLSQAIDHYAGWDRPIFYSLAIFPLHAMRSLWPIVVAQALLTAWLLRRICHLAAPSLGISGFLLLIAGLALGTWLPWLVSEVMPDLLTPLLILALWALAWQPERMAPREILLFIVLASFMIATQQSSVPLSLAVIGVAVILGRRPDGTGIGSYRAVLTETTEPACGLHGDCHGGPRRWTRRARSALSWLIAWVDGMVSRRKRRSSASVPLRESSVQATGRLRVFFPPQPTPAGPSPDGSTGFVPSGRGLVSILHALAPRPFVAFLPPVLAVLALCSVNLAAHGRFAVSPFGNVFLLARALYDGPGMEALRRDCPDAKWRLCAFRDRMPESSDAFLWTEDSPLNLAGGPKQVSTEANAIIRAGLRADPLGAAAAVLRNTTAQLIHFASGDGLGPWPAEVTPVITAAFPAAEAARYAAARQQSGTLTVPAPLSALHGLVAIAGTIACILLLRGALRRNDPVAGLLIAVLVALPANAAITGALSGPHDRYQARLMWLPAFVVALALVSRRPAQR